MLKRRNLTTRKNRNRKGFFGKRSKPRKINASTAYETFTEQLSLFGGLLPYNWDLNLDLLLEQMY